MKTKLILALLVLGSSVSVNAQVFGKNADAGVVIGGVVGAVIGHNNGQKVWQGAAIGAGVGLVAGAIIDNNQHNNHYNTRVVNEHQPYPYCDRDDGPTDYYPNYHRHRRVIVISPAPRTVLIHRPTTVYHNVYTYPSNGYAPYTPPCPTPNSYSRPSNHNVGNRLPANNSRRR